MSFRYGQPLLLGLILTLTGCSSLGEKTNHPRGPGDNPCFDDNGPVQTTSAKTLLEWAAGEEDKGNACEQANGQAEDADNGPNGSAEQEEDEIETDRPDFTEASTTVGRGRVQLEAGYTYIRDQSRGTQLRAHSYPEALFRIGLFADWFELRVGQNFSTEQQDDPDGTRESASGAEDLYLGVKLALTEQRKWLPEMAVILQTTVPTGADAFSAHEMLPGVNWLYGWDVSDTGLSVGGSSQANRAQGTHSVPILPGGVPLALLGETEVDHSYLELAQSLSIGYTLTPKLGAYTEWFALFPHSALDPDIGPEHYFNGGFTYKVTRDFQLDIRGGVGLNEHALDWFVGSGFSVRR